MEVAATAILRTETIPDPPPAASGAPASGAPASGAPGSTVSPSTLGLQTPGSPATPPSSYFLVPGPSPTPAEMHELLTTAGQTHNIDADLLASVVHAESNGNPRAVSPAGARGLMQLMPGTASLLGVINSFAPDQNIGGGTAYLDQLLTRYHDNIAPRPGRLQRRPRSSRPLPRHPALCRDPRLRRPRHPRVQPPQTRRQSRKLKPDGRRKIATSPHRTRGNPSR